MKGTSLFRDKVNKTLVKKLTEAALKHCKKVGHSIKSHEDDYMDYFYIHLAKFMKSWGELFTFIDGTKSEFYNAYIKLKKGKIDFDIDPPEHLWILRELPGAPQVESVTEKKKPPSNEFANQAQEIFTFVSQLSPDTWISDKDTLSQVLQQISTLQKKIKSALQQAEQNPDINSTILLDVNMKLGNLQGLISKAEKGDRASAMKIVHINNPGANDNGIFV